MKKPTIRFRKLWDKHGKVHGMSDGDTITINLMTSGHVGNTALHERLHWLHPDWSETRVKRETAKTWRKMNTYQRFKFYKWVFSRRFR